MLTTSDFCSFFIYYSIPSIDLPPTKITNLATFVERLIQDTFFEAFHEYYMSQTKTLNRNKDMCQINLGYEVTDEENIVVTLRRKLKFNGVSKEDSTAIKTDVKSSCPKKSCVHKKVQQVYMDFAKLVTLKKSQSNASYRGNKKS